MSQWKHLYVPDILLQALQDEGFDAPTPIQSFVLPSAIRDRKDILAAAETVRHSTVDLPIICYSNIIFVHSIMFYDETVFRWPERWKFCGAVETSDWFQHHICIMGRVCGSDKEKLTVVKPSPNKCSNILNIELKSSVVLLCFLVNHFSSCSMWTTWKASREEVWKITIIRIPAYPSTGTEFTLENQQKMPAQPGNPDLFPGYWKNHQTLIFF